MANKIAPPHFFTTISSSPNAFQDWARNVSTSLAAFFHILTEAFNDLVDEETATAGTVAALSARVLVGTGTPEGAVTAPVGTLFIRTDGGAGTVLYVKETGAGNTGWDAK